MNSAVGSVSKERTDQVGSLNKLIERSFLVAQPNGSRLSCGALKKDSFPNLRATASFKRLLDGRLASGAGELTIDVPVLVLPNHHLQLVSLYGGSEGPHAALRRLRIRGVENPLLHSTRAKSDHENGFALRLERYAEAVFDFLQRGVLF